MACSRVDYFVPSWNQLEKFALALDQLLCTNRKGNWAASWVSPSRKFEVGYKSGPFGRNEAPNEPTRLEQGSANVGYSRRMPRTLSFDRH